MLVIVFRARLKPGLRDEYIALVDRMAALARTTMPGYLSHKGFFADDGERVPIVEFEHEEGLRTWRRNPEHIAAQKLAREKYYTEYHVQVCTLDRESHFKAQETEMRAVANQTEAAK
jgi:heme-degrading monooxygenase HmoA